MRPIRSSEPRIRRRSARAVVQLVVKPSLKQSLGNTASVSATSRDGSVPANNLSALQIPVVP